VAAAALHEPSVSNVGTNGHLGASLAAVSSSGEVEVGPNPAIGTSTMQSAASFQPAAAPPPVAAAPAIFPYPLQGFAVLAAPAASVVVPPAASEPVVGPPVIPPVQPVQLAPPAAAPLAVSPPSAGPSSVSKVVPPSVAPAAAAPPALPPPAAPPPAAPPPVVPPATAVGAGSNQAVVTPVQPLAFTPSQPALPARQAQPSRLPTGNLSAPAASPIAALPPATTEANGTRSAVQAGGTSLTARTVSVVTVLLLTVMYFTFQTLRAQHQQDMQRKFESDQATRWQQERKEAWKRPVYRKSVPVARDSFGSSEETRVPAGGGEDASGSEERSSGSMPDPEATGCRDSGAGGGKGGLHVVAAGLAHMDTDAVASSMAGSGRKVGGLGLN